MAEFQLEYNQPPIKKRRGPGCPWKPGQSGNPFGRPPKELSVTAALQEKLSPGELADALISLIRQGDRAAIFYAIDRIDGKARQALEVTNIDTAALGAQLQALITKK